MVDERVRILCAGDLHLGRHPSRVPSGARRLSVARVWESLVDRAIEQAVDLVALTGDLVDRDNRFYEAIGPLERGVRRLGDAGISTFAVAGNHDFDVLPRLVDAVGSETFHLLGRGGRWEEHVVERNGEPLVRLFGWSFPREHVEQSPLSRLDFEPVEAPTVCLLHAELDKPNSPYAPVTTAELEARPAAAWLLGHIHRPQATRTPSDGLILYPGSPQALDPGERGVHGPWIVEVGPGVRPEARQLPLATVRYRTLAIDLEGVESPGGFERAATEQVREDLESIAEGAGPLERVVYRLRYRGRTPLHRRLGELSEQLVDELELSFDGIQATVDRANVDTRPAVDLEQIARGHDPPAVLAGLLLEVRDGKVSEARKPLIAKLRRRLRKAHGSNAHAPLRADRATSAPPDDDTLDELVWAEGLRLLDELLAQKGGEVAR